MLDFIRPWIDLYKVDLKSFDDKHYRQLGGGSIRFSSRSAALHEMGVWLEIVTLLIPGFNDAEDELARLTSFIASVSPDIPWHVTAFHKDYRMSDPENTTPEMLMRAAAIAKAAGLRYVYAGNLPGRVGRPREHALSPVRGAADRALRLSGAHVSAHRRGGVPRLRHVDSGPLGCGSSTARSRATPFLPGSAAALRTHRVREAAREQTSGSGLTDSAASSYTRDTYQPPVNRQYSPCHIQNVGRLPRRSRESRSAPTVTSLNPLRRRIPVGERPPGAGRAGRAGRSGHAATGSRAANGCHQPSQPPQPQPPPPPRSG